MKFSVSAMRYGFATLLLLAVVAIAYMLMRELATESTNEGLTALLGALVGALSMALRQATDDLFNVKDDVGGNGHEPPDAPK